MKKLLIALMFAMSAFAVGCGQDACGNYDDLNCDGGLDDVPFGGLVGNIAGISCEDQTENSSDAELECAAEASSCGAWDACIAGSDTTDTTE